jgi:SAM-dependent methyltransferase
MAAAKYRKLIQAVDIFIEVKPERTQGLQTISRANKERFDSIASTFDDNPGRIALARAVAGAILDTIPLTGQERAMEFGCGTGLVTALLTLCLKSVLAVDASRQMLDVLDAKSRELHIYKVETVEVDIAHDIPKGPFDFVFSSMTLHHIEDVPRLIKRIYQCVTPGGRVAFADLLREDGRFHAENVPGVVHHGFEEAALLAWIMSAGFIDARVRQVHVVKKPRPNGVTQEYPILLATGRRPV